MALIKLIDSEDGTLLLEYTSQSTPRKHESIRALLPTGATLLKVVNATHVITDNRMAREHQLEYVEVQVHALQ